MGGALQIVCCSGSVASRHILSAYDRELIGQDLHYRDGGGQVHQEEKRNESHADDGQYLQDLEAPA